MRFQLYFLLPLFFAYHGYCQPGFNQIYDLDAPSCTFINGLLENDTIFLMGSFNQDSLPGVQGIFMLKADTNGNILNVFPYFDTEYKDLAFSERADIIRLDNGDFVTCGGYLSELSLFLIRFTTQGEVVLFKKIPLDSTTSAGQYELSFYKGGFLIHGILVNLQNKFNTYLIRTDQEGNVIWEKRYGAPGKDESSRCMKVLDENTIVIGSTTGDFLTSPYIHSRIYAVDSLGEIKWTWQSPANNEGLV
ncbi:MAG TPA: hypothetical protein PKG89_13820, partial [Ferruginibacter sp.]|nr:hypothetical protein [Ferruginibacter sp.]